MSEYYEVQWANKYEISNTGIKMILKKSMLEESMGDIMQKNKGLYLVLRIVDLSENEIKKMSK